MAQSEKHSNPSFPKVDQEPLSAIPTNAIVLFEGWHMKESAIIGNKGHKISSLEYDVENWYPTTVPTTVLGTLIRNGVYPDPYLGMNNMQIPDASDDFNQRYDLAKYSHMPDKSNPWALPYWFRKEFDMPAEYRGKVVWLNLDGLNYRADIWVNGQSIADSNKVVGMFKRFRLNITDAARPGEKNVVAVRIYPLDFTGDPLYAQVEGVHGELGPNGGDAEILRNVTQYSTIGWDWVPAVRDRNMGLWQHVSISATGPVAVADPAAFTKVNISNDTIAGVTVRFFVSNVSAQDQEAKINVTIEPDLFPGKKVTVNSSVNLKANSRIEVVLKPEDHPELTLKKPHLWWPVTYGSQPLYNLGVVAIADGQVSSSAQGKFGVRELDSFILPSGGRAFSVNGKTIRITGGAWISDFLLSWSAQRYRDEVRMMAEGNATLVRVNGCSIMPPDVFFEACDKYGLLVWEDFSRTSVSPDFRKDGLKSRRPPACDSTTYMDNMVDFISRVRGRASLLLWCGSNEDAPQEDTGKALQNEILPQMDGTRIFLPSSSEQPEWSAIDIKTYTGGPWHLVRLPLYYKMYESMETFESKNEIGLASPPTINTLAASNEDFNFSDKEDFPFNQAMGYHDATGSWIMGSTLTIMHQDLGVPSSIAEFLKWGDLYNNQTYRTIFEAANKARPRNEGTILWKSNAAWPSFNWQIFDWNLRANAGYYTMKSALKPLHVQFSHDDAGIQVVSTLGQELNITVSVSIFSADGKNNANKKFAAVIPANKTVFIDSLTDVIKDTSLYFVALDLMDQLGNHVDRTVVWTQRNTKWQELLSIPTADVLCGLLGQKDIDDEIEYSFEVKNTSDFPAVNIMMEITDGVFGKEILPAFWADNALTMIPQETKRVKVRIRKELIKQSPFVLLEGLNVNTATWSISTGEEDHINLKVNEFEIFTEEDKVYLNYSASQLEDKGSRITTFPLKLAVDGKLYRYLSLAVKPGMAIAGRLELTGLTPGEHQVQLGDLSKMISYGAVGEHE